MGILAVIGLIILAFVALAFLGAAFLGSALPLGGLFSAILNIIFNWWILWVPILLIGVIAYVARGGSSRSSSGSLAAVAGFAGGVGASEIGRRLTNSRGDNGDNSGRHDGPATDGAGILNDGASSHNSNPQSDSFDREQNNINNTVNIGDMAASGDINSTAREIQRFIQNFDQMTQTEESVSSSEDTEVRQTEEELEHEDEDLQKIRQLNSEIEQLLNQVHSDFQEIIQHDEQIEKFVEGNHTMREISQWAQSNGGQHLHLIEEDISEIRSDFQKIENKISQKNELAQEVHSLETDERRKFEEMESGIEQLIQVERNIKKLLDGTISASESTEFNNPNSNTGLGEQVQSQ